MITPRRPGAARRALTLIELLIVIAILLAIGGLVVVNLLPKKDEADVNLTRVQIDQFDAALKLFKLDAKRFPSEDEGLRALWSSEALEDDDEGQSWKGPYLESPTPRDTWNNEWLYRFPGEIRGESFYDIISAGPDGEEGTEDDITNHDRLRDEEGDIDEAFDDFTPSDADTGP